MRSSLVWTLVGAVALAALALWVPQRATPIVQAIESRRGNQNSPVHSGALTAQASPPLPQALEPLLIEAARRDPFADGPPAPPPSAANTAVVPKSPLIALPPQAPSPPPPMTWRLLGTMDSPDGERKVLLAPVNESQSVVAAPGLQLTGGYEVVDIGPDGVRLSHPPTQTEVVIPILPSPPAGR